MEPASATLARPLAPRNTLYIPSLNAAAGSPVRAKDNQRYCVAQRTSKHETARSILDGVFFFVRSPHPAPPNLPGSPHPAQPPSFPSTLLTASPITPPTPSSHSLYAIFP